MAGHSKWANIKRHKAKQDARKGKLYTRLIREISVAAKLGGGDPSANPRLRAALDKAQEANMTKDVIERAIKRGAGGMEGENLEEVTYEGYGPNGIAILVECLTNNRNRTVAEVRHAFTKAGGSLGTSGSVAYLFKKWGQMTFAPGVDEERLIELSLELGVEDVIINEDKSVDVLTAPDGMIAAKQVLAQYGFHPEQAEVGMVAGTTVTISDKELVETVLNLLDMLEELDDVQAVYSNADVIESI